MKLAPINDTASDTLYWEPWVPEPGQAVRIVLSGECRELWSDDCTPGHPTWMHGRTGIVGPETREDWPATDRAAWERHRFTVHLDELGPDYSHAALLAAIELEPRS